MPSLGGFIRERRKELGISQKALAGRILREEDDAPISPQYLNDIELDRRSPTSEHLIAQFANALEVPPDYLFFLAGTLPQDIRERPLALNDVVQAFSAFRKSKG